MAHPTESGSHGNPRKAKQTESPPPKFSKKEIEDVYDLLGISSSLDRATLCYGEVLEEEEPPAGGHIVRLGHTSEANPE